MDRSKIVDAVGMSAIVLWIIISAKFALAGNGAMFARLGAIGTAVAAGYFASIKHSVPYPIGLHEKLQLTNNMMNYQAEMARVSLVNSSLLAVGVKKLYEEAQSSVPSYVLALADEKLLTHAASTGPLPLDEWEAANGLNVQRSLTADALVSHVSFRAGQLQAWIVVIATLQWGFGDLLFTPTTN